nr:MAG TPA: hypothetical protein [Caudoviricetes sp.]
MTFCFRMLHFNAYYGRLADRLISVNINNIYGFLLSYVEKLGPLSVWLWAFIL